jgi:hypothetical protein
MGFKADTSFLRFLSMGAVGVHRTMERLRDRGFKPIELERYCGSNKIWATKVKRLRLPDLLCVKTGMRAEVRAKTDLKIRMSDAPANPDRVWDAGLRDDDIVALITCFDSDDGPEPAEDAVYFTVGALRASVGQSRLGPPKSAAEGAERDRTWPATVPTRGGTVLEVTPEKLVVQQHADPDRPARRQTYTIRGKSVYVSPGDPFTAETTILAGAPPALADLSVYLPHRYTPLEDLRADSDVDRYAAVKALRFRDDPRDRVIPALEDLIRREAEKRVTLEAAGSAVALGSEFGQERISGFVWENDGRPELRMEAVFILTELGPGPFTRSQLTSIATAPRFHGDELRQAAVWGLGKAGLKSYEDLLPFIDDADENAALHAIAAFGPDTPRTVIDRLIQDLVAADPQRAPAASEVLHIIASDDVLQALVAAANATQPVPDWILATLGRLPPDLVRGRLQGSPLLDRIAPMLLTAQGANWLASEAKGLDIAFLLKQNLG